MTENVELVRAVQPGPDIDLVQFFGRADGDDAGLRAIEPLLHHDFNATGHGGVTFGPHRGLAGLRHVWLEWLSPWDSYRSEIEDVVDLGDKVLVVVRGFGTKSGFGEVTQQSAAIWEVKDGKLARADFYADRTEAVRAASPG